MQLKRDTDYALRILLCAAQHSGQNKAGLTLLELSRKTSVPRTVAFRLCKTLEDQSLLRVVEPEADVKRYSVESSVLRKTVYDVVVAIEKSASLFAVFDPRTELYVCGESCFAEIDRQIAGLLKSVSLRDLKSKAKNEEK